MELAGVMENVLDTLVRDTCRSEAEAGHDGEEIPCREESEGGVDVEYRSHTPGSLTRVKISSRIGIWMLWGMKRKT